MGVSPANKKDIYESHRNSAELKLSDLPDYAFGQVLCHLEGDAIRAVWKATRLNLSKIVHFVIKERLRKMIDKSTNRNRTQVLQDCYKRCCSPQNNRVPEATYWLPLLDYFEYADLHDTDEYPVWIGRLRFIRRDSFQLIESNVVVTCLAKEWNPGMIPRVDGTDDNDTDDSDEGSSGSDDIQITMRMDNGDNEALLLHDQQNEEARQQENDVGVQRNRRGPFVQQGRVYVLNHWDKIVLWDPRREGMTYVFPYLDNLRFTSIQMRGADPSAGHCLKCYWKSNEQQQSYQKWKGVSSVDMLVSQVFATMRNLKILKRNLGVEAFKNSGFWSERNEV